MQSPKKIKSAVEKGETMQLHKRMTTDQARVILDWYEKGIITKVESLKRLGIKERRFFKLVKSFRNKKDFQLQPKRLNTHRKISPYLDRLIKIELEKEKSLIKDVSIPLAFYNFTAVRDEIFRQAGSTVSAKTISNRARTWGYVNPPKPKRTHDRVVLTTASGLLLQHDSSEHLWAPFAEEKWVLITTIDDYSRYLLYAEFVNEESAWAHIEAVKKITLTYGVGSNYYVDNHSIFRFVRKTDNIWQSPKVDANTVMTQWKRTVQECGMGIIYALSPEAKGKVERPYRWLQDRIVRRCAKEGVTTIERAKEILAEEVHRYNDLQVHSTTKEIPKIRFERSKREGNWVFRPLVLPKPYTSTKDIFCIKEKRIVDGYGQISFRKRMIKLPKHIPEGAEINIHVCPDPKKPEVRLWYKDNLLQVIILHQTKN